MIEKKNIEKKNIANYVCIPKKFREDYFGNPFKDELLKESILVPTLIVRIMSDLSEYQYHPNNNTNYWGPDNQKKLELWNNEFLGNNIAISLIYNVSNFLKNRDKEKMKKTLIFLQNFQAHQYSFTNYKGEKISTYGGLINSFLFAENSGNFEIQISQYWATRIVEKINYNRFYTKLLKFKNNKQILFAMWLIELPEIKTNQGIQRGTSISYKIIQHRFDLKYKSNYDFCKNWLLPIKTKMDNLDEGESFNYKIDDTNSDNINIVLYNVKPSKIKINNNINQNIITYKKNYIKRRHYLNDIESNQIKLIIQDDFYKFEDNYKNFVKMYKTKKINASDIRGEEFINKFTEFLKDI